MTIIKSSLRVAVGELFTRTGIEVELIIIDHERDVTTTKIICVELVVFQQQVRCRETSPVRPFQSLRK